MAAEPFIPPPEPAPADLGVRSAWALGFIAFGLAIAGAVLAYMLPQSIEAQWRNPPTHGVVTKVERRQGSDDSSTWYRIAWTTPAGEERTGSISPLLESFHVGQRVPLRYAHRAGADRLEVGLGGREGHVGTACVDAVAPGGRIVRIA